HRAVEIAVFHGRDLDHVAVRCRGDGFTRRLELLVWSHLEGLGPSRPLTAQRYREDGQAEERISWSMPMLDSDLPGRKGHFTLPSPDRGTIWPLSLLPVRSASV